METEDILKVARKAHMDRTGHKKFFLGMNFIECDVCKKHAHESHGKLIVHDSAYTVNETITANEF